MITKLTMFGVACYKNPTHLETDKKVNLIYGLNGTGKSTISNFLYDGTCPEYSGCAVVGEKGKEVLVYNNKFVRDHFYEIDKLNGIFTLSKENTEAEKEHESAEKKLNSNKELKEEIEYSIKKIESAWENTKQTSEESTWEIKTKYSGGDRILEFCLEGLKGNKTKLFEHLLNFNKSAVRPLKNIDELKKETELISGEEAQRYSLLAELEFEISRIESNQIFKNAIVGNENGSVAGLISKLGNADWVKNGIQFLDELAKSNDESCPFCQERTISEVIFKEIKGYFDQSYENALIELKNLQSQYSKAIDLISPKSSYQNNPFLEVRFKEFEAQYERLHDLAKRNENKIKAKINAPSQEQVLEESALILEKVNVIIRDANNRITEHNNKIVNKDNELQRIKTDFWEIMRWNYDQVVVSYESHKTNKDNEVKNKNEEREVVSSEIQRLNSQIIEIQKTTVNVDSAIENINMRLFDLGIDSFNIVKHQDNLYRIARDGDLESDFHTLSEGEKTMISFLYFVERCKGKKSALDTVTKRVVVIDDPISSLSHIYVFNVGQMIKSEFFNSSSFEQVFVLTHSLYFFYELTETNHDNRKKDQKLFRLTKNSLGSSLNDMKYEEIRNDYQAYWSIIKDPKQPPALLANCMRNVVEYFFGFVEKQDFCNVFQKEELKANKYQAFNRFMNRESHSFGQNIFDYKEFDYSIFLEALKLVFKENGFLEHYETMMK